jgi:hypothetical protein
MARIWMAYPLADELVPSMQLPVATCVTAGELACVPAALADGPGVGPPGPVLPHAVIAVGSSASQIHAKRVSALISVRSS